MPSLPDKDTSIWAPKGPAKSNAPATGRPTKYSWAKVRTALGEDATPRTRTKASSSAKSKERTPSPPESPLDVYADPALRQIDEVVNMEVDDAQNKRVDEKAARYCLVLDTNVLLGYLDVLEQFVRDSEKCAAPVQIIIPGIVVQELDYQKGSGDTDLKWNARLASTWILDQLKQRKFVKGQAYGETLQVSGTWKKRDAGDVSNDDLIIDCCLFFQKKYSRTLVISADHNLCSNALSQGMNIINPRDSKKWSSRMLASQAFNDRPEIEQIALSFGGSSEIRRSKRQRDALEKDLGEQPPPRYLGNEQDGMDVDDGFNVDMEPSREHLLDNLHRQLLGHFTSLLIDVVRRVAPQMLSDKTPDDGKISVHSPLHALSKLPGAQWNAAHCIRFLSYTSSGLFPKTAAHGDMSTIRAGSTRLANFLTDPYDDGGRKGQEWSRADWYFCLEVLECLGRVWGDEPVLLSLAMLRPQVDVDFVQPMRPT